MSFHTHPALVQTTLLAASIWSSSAFAFTVHTSSPRLHAFRSVSAADPFTKPFLICDQNGISLPALNLCLSWILNVRIGTSLVVQWLRTCLEMQGAWV